MCTGSGACARSSSRRRSSEVSGSAPVRARIWLLASRRVGCPPTSILVRTQRGPVRVRSAPRRASRLRCGRATAQRAATYSRSNLAALQRRRCRGRCTGSRAARTSIKGPDLCGSRRMDECRPAGRPPAAALRPASCDSRPSAVPTRPDAHDAGRPCRLRAGCSFPSEAIRKPLTLAAGFAPSAIRRADRSVSSGFGRPRALGAPSRGPAVGPAPCFAAGRRRRRRKAVDGAPCSITVRTARSRRP